jgi:hypothetical protein
MRSKFLFIFIIFALTVGCQNQSDTTNPEEKPAATVVKEAGRKYNLVILSQEAANRIGLELTPAATLSTVNVTQVPYSALIYGTHGETWVYLQVKPLTFTRETIAVDHIEGNTVFLSNGLPANTQVVAQGATELYGVEYIGNIEP